MVVAYQSKWNNACSIMLANIFTRTPPPPQKKKKKTWGWVKRSKHGLVPYQFKSNYEYSNMVAHILSLFKPSTSGGGGGVKVKRFFAESRHGAYQLRREGAKSTMQAHILSFHAPSTQRVANILSAEGQNPIFFRIRSCCISN